MKNKFMPLVITCLLISFSALSQAPGDTSHPKLNAFRQLKANSRAAADSAAAASTTKTNDVISQGSPATAVPASTDNIATKPASTPSPVVTNLVSQPTNAPVTQIQEQPAPVAKQQPHTYNDTRLGSSSPQYNTYEKNNYGAGSVTTSPK